MNETVSTLAERLRRIEKVWPRFAWDALGRSRWRSFDGVFWSTCIGVTALLAAVHLELLLRTGEQILFGIGDLGQSAPGRILLTGLILGNAWILDRVLRAKTPAGLRPAPWLRCLRPLVLVFPVLSLSAFPVWRWLVENKPGWAFLPPASTESLQPDRPSSWENGRIASWTIDLWLLRQAQSLPALLVWLVAIQITPLFSLTSWLALAGRSGGPFHTAALAAAVFLHVVAAVSALIFAELKIRRLQITGWRTVAFRCMPCALLVPLAAGLPLFAITLILAAERREEHGVQHTLFEHWSVRRMVLGAKRAVRLHEVTGRREQARRRFAWTKIAFLLPEVAILTGLAGVESFLPAAAFLLSALAGCVFFAGEAAERLAGRRLRFLPRPVPLMGATWTAASVAAGAGVLLGALATSQPPKEIGLFLLVLGLSGIVLTLLALMWSGLLSIFFGAPERPLTGRAAAMAVGFVVMLLGTVLTRLELDPHTLDTLRSASLLGLLVGPAVAVACRPWRFSRVRSGFTLLISLLPLGGLLVSIWLRSRLQF